MPKKQREFLEDEKVDSPPSEAPTSQTSATGSMLQKNPKTKEAVDSLEIEETVKTEETLETKDLNSTEKTSEYSNYAEKSSISETKSSRSNKDPSDNRETRSDKSFTKSGDLDSNLCISKGSSCSIEKRDDQDFIEKDRQESSEENQNSTEKEGSKLGQLDDEKDRMRKKQREFLEDEKAVEVDSPPSEAPKTKGSSSSIEKRDDQDSTERDRQESFEENQNSTKKEGSKLGQLDEEKDRMPKKQREFLEDEKAEEVDPPPSEALKTKGSSGSIEKRDDQDSTERDRQESFEENQNSTKKEGSKLGQQEKIASKGKSKGLSLEEIKKLQEKVKSLMLGNNLVKVMEIIHKIEENHASEYSAMVYGFKASVQFDIAKELLMKDWLNIPKSRDPGLCFKMLQESLQNAEKAAGTFPNCLEFSVVIAHTLQFLKEYQRVKDLCDRALSLKPTELVNNLGGPVTMEEAKMQTKALEKLKNSAEEEISKANATAEEEILKANAIDSTSSETTTSDGKPARSRRNMNSRRSGTKNE